MVLGIQLIASLLSFTLLLPVGQLRTELNDPTAYSRLPDGTLMDWADLGNSCSVDDSQNLILSYDDGRKIVETQIQISDPYASGYFLSDEVTAVARHAPQGVQIEVSYDKGTTWQESFISNDSCGSNGQIWVGFSSATFGWVVLCSNIAMGSEHHWIYLTRDGGASWEEIPGNLDQVHGRMLCGFGFADASWGVACFRYEDERFMPAVCMTTDGGKTWVKESIVLPPEYDSLNKTPFSPLVRQGQLIVPIWLTEPGSGKHTATVYWICDRDSNATILETLDTVTLVKTP